MTNSAGHITFTILTAVLESKIKIAAGDCRCKDEKVELEFCMRVI